MTIKLGGAGKTARGRCPALLRRTSRKVGLYLSAWGTSSKRQSVRVRERKLRSATLRSAIVKANLNRSRPRALGSLPLLHRCDLYRLTLVRRQDAAEGHAN
jgi:hypothetical protein